MATAIIITTVANAGTRTAPLAIFTSTSPVNTIHLATSMGLLPYTIATIPNWTGHLLRGCSGLRTLPQHLVAKESTKI